jgi:pimeloyl-ACP methyl ester carboxylesterase
VRVRIGDLDVAYARAGHGPPLVLLHGALCDCRLWRRQLAELSDEFTVVAWEEPGAGRSSDPPEDFTLADYADTLAEFIGALALAPAHVAGLSWGGVLAQELYRRHSECVASLILADTYAGWKGSLPEDECAARLARAQLASSLPPEEFVPAYLPGLLADEAPAEVEDELLSMMRDFHPISVRLTSSAIGACDQRDLLPWIAVPTLLVWGEADARSPVAIGERFRDAIPDARLVVIPGAGHVSNMEQPERFNAAVRDFCRSATGQLPRQIG